MRGYAAIGLINPKTNANVGGVMRAAHCYGASLIAVQGARYGRQVTDTTKAFRSIPLVHGDLHDLVPYDCVPVAVEFIDGSHSLVKYRHPERAFYIFGPEDGSISKSVLSWCRDVVMVPTNYCMNLSATANVLLYDRLAKGVAA